MPPALAQATFTVQNYEPAYGVDAPVFDARGSPLEGSDYLAQLYGGVEPDKLSPTKTKGGLSVIAPFRESGYFVGRSVSIATVAPGLFAWLQVRAWDARLGATYEEVVTRSLGGYGESPLFRAQGGMPGQIPTPPGRLIGLQSFRLRPITPALLMRGVHNEGDQIIIEWHPGFPRYQLQQTPSLAQPWRDVGEPTTDTSATNAVSGTAQFFRVMGLLE
jgi:hypothetical protein